MIGLGRLLATLTLSLACARAELAVYFEDSHAGSFYFLSEHLDLDEAHTLVLIDAHSDASPVPASDGIREGLRRVSS